MRAAHVPRPATAAPGRRGSPFRCSARGSGSGLRVWGPGLRGGELEEGRGRPDWDAGAALAPTRRPRWRLGSAPMNRNAAQVSAERGDCLSQQQDRAGGAGCLRVLLVFAACTSSVQDMKTTVPGAKSRTGLRSSQFPRPPTGRKAPPRLSRITILVLSLSTVSSASRSNGPAKAREDEWRRRVRDSDHTPGRRPPDLFCSAPPRSPG